MLRGNKGNKVINWLKNKKSGKVKKIGVSIYETKDIDDKHMEWIDIIQAPYSIYDQRIMLESNRLKEEYREMKLNYTQEAYICKV